VGELFVAVGRGANSSFWSNGTPQRLTILVNVLARVVRRAGGAHPGGGRRRLRRQPAHVRELNERSNQLAHWLRHQEVGPDVLVGVCMERSAEMVIACTNPQGRRTYVPLDPDYPRARLEAIVEDSDLGIVLTQDHLQGLLAASSGQALCLDSQWEHE